MVAKKPPALPPDTTPVGGHPSAGAPPLDAVKLVRAKNPESFDSPDTEICRTQVPTIATHGPHQVLFTVFQDRNAIRFLSELLTNLLLVNSTSKILPTMEAHAAYPVLGRNCACPTNATELFFFAKAYLVDLKVSSKGDMKGKVLLRTQAHFLTLWRKTQIPRNG